MGAFMDGLRVCGPLVVVFGLWFLAGLSDFASGDDLRPKVDRQVTPLIDGEVATGLAVGLIDGDKTYVYGYGTANSGGKRVPDGETVFEIGSMTKVFTGILLADMVERKLVSLDDPVARYLPKTVTVPSKGDRQITLLDLATHRSGLPRLPDNLTPKDPSNPYADYTVAQLYAFLSKYTLPRAPGERYEYSNLGMGLLGHALALRAGSSYEDLVVSRICMPLGMTSTRITLTPELRARLATGHDADGNTVSNWDLPTLAGAGALRSTVHDMLRFLATNLGTTPSPIQTALADSQVSRRAIEPDGSIGLAWHIFADGKTRWHNGGTGGYRSFMALDKEHKRAVVVLCNSFTDLVDPVGINLLHVLAGETPDPVKVKIPVKVDPQVLEAYKGVYELAPNFTLTVTREGDRLMAEATGQGRFRLYPASDTEFFFRVANAQVTFVKNDKGVVEKLILHQNGRDIPGKKIK